MKFCRPFIAYTQKAFKIKGHVRKWAHIGRQFWSILENALEMSLEINDMPMVLSRPRVITLSFTMTLRYRER